MLTPEDVETLASSLAPSYDGSTWSPAWGGILVTCGTTLLKRGDYSPQNQDRVIRRILEIVQETPS